MHTRSLFILSLLLLSACQSTEAQIKEQIFEANHCETASDCVDVGAKCPFGCYIFVNKSESDRIKAMVDGYESDCVYSCIAISGVECVENKCEPVEDTAL